MLIIYQETTKIIRGRQTGRGTQGGEISHKLIKEGGGVDREKNQSRSAITAPLCV